MVTEFTLKKTIEKDQAHAAAMERKQVDPASRDEPRMDLNYNGVKSENKDWPLFQKGQDVLTDIKIEHS